MSVSGSTGRIRCPSCKPWRAFFAEWLSNAGNMPPMYWSVSALRFVVSLPTTSILLMLKLHLLPSTQESFGLTAILCGVVSPLIVARVVHEDNIVLLLRKTNDLLVPSDLREAFFGDLEERHGLRV